MAISSAFLGNSNVFHTFKFNPYAVNWSYSDNTRSFDTLGGRVVQLLSAKLDGMTVQGVAGSRAELQKTARDLKNIMDFHIKTQDPVSFKVPSREWDFLVYLQSVGNLGWDVQTVVYPYQLNLSVVNDLSGIKTKEINAQTLDRLATGIGYNPNVHGGDGPGFAELVNNLQLAYKTQNTGGIDEGDEGGGADTGGGGGGETPAPGTTDTAGTAAIRQVKSYVFGTYSKAVNLGIYNCRKIKDSSSWSQHAWANGLDIGANGNSNYLNTIASDLLGKARGGKLPIAQILWQKTNLLSGGSVYDHTDHIHISGDPMYSGTPPCAS